MSIYMHNETFTPFGMEEKEEKRREMNERMHIYQNSFPQLECKITWEERKNGDIKLNNLSFHFREKVYKIKK